MLKFDHCYTNDPGHRFWKKLERLGFSLYSAQTEHPGKLYCRFIAINDLFSDQRQYLEFISGPPKHPHIRHPGLLLSCAGKLKNFSNRLKRKKLNVEYSHKNYDWKNDSKSYLPGWNFVRFKKLGFRGPHIYLVEYEKRPKTVKRPKIHPHPNGIQNLVAIELDLNPAAMRFYSGVLGTRHTEFKLACGTQVFLRASKRNKFNAVVLQSRNFKQFLKISKIKKQTEWQGRPAAFIKNPSNMWHIIVI